MTGYSDSHQSAALAHIVAAQARVAEREKEKVWRRHLAHVRELLDKRLTEIQFNNVCQDLGVLGELPGTSKPEWATALVDRMDREDRIEDLIELAQNERPDLDWAGASLGEARTTPIHVKDTGSRTVIGPAPADVAPTAFDRDAVAEERARIIKQMSQVLNELDSYVHQYGAVTKALQISLRLQEKLEKLKAVPISDPVWELYLESLDPYYKDLSRTAFSMRDWRQSRIAAASTAQPSAESTQTQELRIKLQAEERKILPLIENYLQAYEAIYRLMQQLQESVSSAASDGGDPRPALRRELSAMQDWAENITLSIHAIITDLIKKELNAQLAELRALKRRA
jgi:hypothetical protein